MEFQRDFYLSKLLRKRGNGLVKVITGLRRCGKSYLLRKLFKERLHAQEPGLKFIEVAFDERDNKALCDADAFYNYAKRELASGEPVIFLLDEIQLLDDFESVLNGLLGKHAEIYVTGSNAKFLSKDIITEFRGRGDEIHITPLSFAEYFAAYPDDKYLRLQEYMLYGGLPVVASSELPEDKISILKSLYTETYLRDIVGRNHLRKSAELEDLLDVLSSNIGCLINPEKLRNIFHSVKKSNITATTLKRYLDILDDAYLIESAKRYDIKGNAYIETPQKYYYGDLGLRNARIGFRQVEETHSLENIVYNELRHRGYNVDIGVVTFNEKGADGKYARKDLEIDFVANMGTKRYYIQSAYMLPDAAKQEQEKRPLRKIDDSFKKIIVTMQPVLPLYDERGILTMSIYDFLLKENSLEL
jgi:uncharacterized protein